MVKNNREANISQMEADLRNLGEAQQLRAEDIRRKEAEQRSYMVDARVRKDPSAQGNIDRLSREIAILQAANLQDYGAAEEVRAQIEAEKSELEREERRTRYGALLQLLRPRANGALEKRLVDLAKQMAATASELADSDNKIVSALSTFGPALSSEPSQIRYRAVARRDYISALLSDVVETPIPRSYGETAGDPVEAAVRGIGGIMLDVEAASEIGPEKATAGISSRRARLMS
jgi:hypothetical protein